MSRLENEASSIAECLRKLVEENARVRRDQAEYQREYDRLVVEYDRINAQIQAMENQSRNRERAKGSWKSSLAFCKIWRCAKLLSHTPLRRWWKRWLSGVTDGYSSASGTGCNMSIH